MPVLLPEAARPPRFHPVDLPVAPYFHPELGYLAPSRWLRRKLRTAAAIVLAGSVIAASTALALMAPAAVEGANDPEPQVMAASPAVPVEPAMAALPAPPPVQVPPRAQGACDDPSTAFLLAQCRTGRLGKARLAHGRAIQRLSAVAIGRADAETASDAKAPQAVPVAEAATATPKPPPAAVPAKPRAPARTVRKERPSQDVAAAEPGTTRDNSGGLPRFVLPSLFGGADWARSW